MADEINGQDYDPDFSHAMLIAVLMKLVGHVALDPEDLASDARGYQWCPVPVGTEPTAQRAATTVRRTDRAGRRHLIKAGLKPRSVGEFTSVPGV